MKPEQKAELQKHTAELQKQNDELKQRLQEYKSLEEDLMANRVFRKAKKQFSVYLTVGGIVIVLGAIVGINAITDYAKSLAKDKIAAMTTDEIKNDLQVEGKRQITVLVEGQRPVIVEFTKQQLARLTLATQPIGELKAAPTDTTARAVDYTARMPTVKNSGNEGSTVGFAVATTLEYQIEKTLGKRITISPRYIYYCARLKTGNTDTDSGAMLRDAIDALLKNGGVAEEAWPYKAGEFAAKPPKNIDQAERFKISRAWPVHDVKELKAALQTYGPVVGGFAVYESGESADALKTGIIPIPSPKEPIIGGHAVCFVGFDDSKKLLKFQNQWGTDWGDKGYGYISYEYAEAFLNDAWAISMK